MMNEDEIKKTLGKAMERAYGALKQARATMAPEDVEKALWEALKAKAMLEAKSYGPRVALDDCEDPAEWGPEKQLDESIRRAGDDDTAWEWVANAVQGALADVLRGKAWKEMSE